MQWLIDLIIEAIGIPPVYIDRGDPAVYDWDKNDLTTDAAWHDLDLSSIVPANAKAVAIRTIIRDDLVAQAFAMRMAGKSNTYAIQRIRTQIANVYNEQTIVVSLSTDRKISYEAANVVWSNIFLVINGWWL